MVKWRPIRARVAPLLRRGLVAPVPHGAAAHVMQAYGGAMVPQNPPAPPLIASDTINIPHGPEVNFLIGRGGATISQLEQECQCKIAIQKAAEMLPGSTTRIVTITGADAAKRARAASLIHAKVGEYRVSGTAAGGLPPPTGASSAPSYVPLAPSAPTLAAEGEVTVIHVPNGPEVNFIIGKGGGTINEIQRESGCHIAIQKVSEVERGAATRLVTIFGADSGQRARCVELVLAKVAEYTASGAAVVNSSGGAGGGESLPSNTLVIEIPNGARPAHPKQLPCAQRCCALNCAPSRPAQARR